MNKIIIISCQQCLLNILYTGLTGKSVRVPCKADGCPCKAYAWVPNRVEDIGEFWHQRRRDFDPTKWRPKCKCKHTNIFHDPNTRRCKTPGKYIP